MNNIMNNVPCVRIVPRNGQRDYVDITNNDSGCFAYGGNRGGRHQLNLNRRGGCSGVSTMALNRSKGTEGT